MFASLLLPLGDKRRLPEFGSVVARRIPGVVFLTKSQPYHYTLLSKATIPFMLLFHLFKSEYCLSTSVWIQLPQVTVPRTCANMTTSLAVKP